MRIWIAAAVAALALVTLGTAPAGTGFAQSASPSYRTPGTRSYRAPATLECRVPSFTYKHGTVTFTEHGSTAEVRVEIADTPESQEAGLMCRTQLDPDAGMLFVFADDTRDPFWMKNTLIPLSIAFVDAKWRIVGLMDMRVAPDPSNPPPSDLYAPPKPYRYALEVNQGFFAQHGIDVKAEVHFLRQNATATPPAGSPASSPAAAAGCRAGSRTARLSH